MPSTECPGSKRFPQCPDALIAAMVFLLAAVGSWIYLTASGLTPGPERGDSIQTIMPAALWALGRNISDSLVAPMWSFPQAFLDFCLHKTDVLRPDQFPHELFLPIKGETKFLHDRLYLLYAIGLLWRLVGISWSSLNILASLFAGLTAAIGYGICRLGMGRLVALATVALTVSSPVLLAMLPTLRDLCKAPFILSAILVVGYLLSATPRKRPLLLMAAIIGLFLGVGMGFRQDILIALPPLLVSFFFAPGVKPFRVTFRMLTVAVFLVCFLVPAAPVLKMNRETGGNNSFYLMQGFSCPMLADADITRASYGPFYSSDDFIMHATVTHYYAQVQKDYCEKYDKLRKVFHDASVRALPLYPGVSLVSAGVAMYCRTDLGIWTNESEQITRNLVRDVATTFPADVITRWYGAALRCVRGLMGANLPCDMSNPFVKRSLAFHAPFVNHIRTFGLFYAGIVFLVLCGKGFRLGMGAALIPIYFCGYTSMEFQFRHAFHLDIASYWMAGFLLNAGILLVTRHIAVQGPWPHVRVSLWTPGMPRVVLRRLLAGLCAMGLFLTVPLGVARLVQGITVNKLIERYRGALLEPVPAVQRQEPDGQTLYAPVALENLKRSTLSPDILNEYLVLEFETKTPAPVVCIKYVDSKDTTHALNEAVGLDATDVCSIADTRNAGTIRYFFPAFDFSKRFQESASQGCPLPKFAGIVVPKDVSVKGLYRVRNKDQFPILMNVWLPDNTALFKKHYALPFVDILAVAWQCARTGDFLGATADWRSTLMRDPRNMNAYCDLAKYLAAAGDTTAAADTYRRAIDVDPSYRPSYFFLDGMLQSQADTAARIAEWRAVAQRHPDTEGPHLMLARALRDAGETDAAIAAYGKALAQAPNDLDVRQAFSEFLMTSTGDPDALYAVHQNILLFDSASTMLATYSMEQAAVRFQAMGNPKKALWAYAGLFDIATRHAAWLNSSLLCAIARQDGIERVLRACQSAVTADPSLAPVAADALARRAVAQLQDRQWDRAIVAANAAIQYKTPYIDALRVIAAASGAKGDQDAAIQAYRSILCSRTASEADFDALDEILIKQDRLDIRERIWKDIANAAPDLASRIEMRIAAEATYYAILAANPEGEKAYATVDELCAQQGNNAARLAALRAIAQQYPRARLAHLTLARALEQQHDYEAALEAYQKACELSPQDSALLQQYAQAIAVWAKQLLEQGRLDEALTAAQNALAVTPQSFVALLTVARVLEEQGNAPEAIAMFRKTIAADPTAQEPYGRLDNLLLRQSNPPDRVAVWRDITQAVPKAARAFVYLGDALDAVQDYPAEVEAYRAAWALDPNDAVAEASLGVGLMRIYQYKESRERLQAALDRQPGLPATYYEVLVSLLSTEKDYDTARRYVEKCKSLGITLSTPILDALTSDAPPPQ